MELQLGKQEHRMYTRVFDRTEEETCSVDAVVPDALGDLSALVVTEGTFCLWNLAFSDKSAQIEGALRRMSSMPRKTARCAASPWSCRSRCI